MVEAATVVDESTPKAINVAIQNVMKVPLSRSPYGHKALLKLYEAPDHSMLDSEMENRPGVLNVNFGWFCKCVAKELGAANPEVFALVNVSEGPNGGRRLMLKPSVVAALSKGE